MAGSQRKRTEWAEAVLTHIPTSDDEPAISVAKLMALTGLTDTEVRRGVQELRDTFNDGDDLPLVSGPDGYRFTLDEATVAGYQLKQCRVAHTTISRLYYGVISRFIKTLPDGDKEAKLTDRQMKRAIEDLALFIGR